MFRNRYSSSNIQHSYIRQRYNAFNTPSKLNETNFGTEGTILENAATIRNEMTPPIGIENDEDEEMMETEEVSEDDTDDNELSEDDTDNYEMDESDIELESEYERIMDEFNESDEDEDNGEGEDDRERMSEESSDEEVITDQALNSEQLPQSVGDFAPYFKNVTESLMFCWMQKHHICKSYFFETCR